MEIKVLIKKEAQIAGLLARHHIVDIDPLLLQFLNFKLAKILSEYFKSYEKSNWEYILKVLDGKIKLDFEMSWWDKVKNELEELKGKFEGFYNKNIGKALELMSKVFLIKKFPEEVEVYLVYNLHPYYSFGSAIYYGNRFLIFQSAGKYEKRTIEDKFSGFLHELIHTLFDYNNIELPSKFEEALLDFFVPYGLLDVKLGYRSLEEVKKKIENMPKKNRKRYEFYKEYFDRLKFLLDYDFSKNIWEWILEKTEDKEIKEICKRVLERSQI